MSFRVFFLRERLPYGIASLLLREHDTEALEVAQRPPPLDRRALLRPRGLLPLRDEVVAFRDLADEARARAAGDALDQDGREGKVPVREGLARDAGCWAVDDCLYT